MKVGSLILIASAAGALLSLLIDSSFPLFVAMLLVAAFMLFGLWKTR